MAAGQAPRGGALAGRTVVVTSHAEGAADLALALAEQGARVVAAPLVAIVDPPDWAPCDAALDRIATYDWLVLTSRTTWPRLAARLASRGRDAASCVERAPQVAAIGPGTAQAARDAGFRVALVAEDARSEGLAAVLAEAAAAKSGVRVLLPRALDARDVLPDALRAAGAVVDAVACYAVEPDRAGRGCLRDAFAVPHAPDAVTLASGSAARALIAAFGDVDEARTALAKTSIATIGPVTSAALRAAGLEPAVEAPSASPAALISALIEHFAARARAREGEEPRRG